MPIIPSKPLAPKAPETRITPAELEFAAKQKLGYDLSTPEALMEVGPSVQSFKAPIASFSETPGTAPGVSEASSFLDPAELVIGGMTGGFTSLMKQGTKSLLKNVARDAASNFTFGLSEVPNLATALPKITQAVKDSKAMKQAIADGAADAMRVFKEETRRPVSPVFSDAPLAAKAPTVTPPVPPIPPPTVTPGGVPQFASALPTPADASKLKQIAYGIRSAFAPASVSPAAEATALTLRSETADFSLRQLRAAHALQKAKAKMDDLPVAVQRDFIIRFENRRAAQIDPELDTIATTLNDIIRSRHKELAKLKILDTFYDDYFPHIWADPAQAKATISGFYQRTLEGSKSFTKLRKFTTYADGLAAGLTPAVENPVEATLLKLREIDKAIMGAKVAKTLKDYGLSKFVRPGVDPPPSWVQGPDPMFRALAKPDVAIHEAFDKGLVDQLNDFAQKLGLRHLRTAGAPFKGAGKKNWGLSYPGTREIVSRFGGPESSIAHEIGHQIGDRFPAIQAIVANPAFNKEMLDLTALRWGAMPTADFQTYTRSLPERYAVLLEGLIHAPAEFRRVAPNLFDAYTTAMRNDPILRQALNIKPSLVLGTGTDRLKAPGLSLMGNWYVPKDVALILDRYLKPGLYAGSPYDPTSRGLLATSYELARGFGNSLNQAQLGLSAFHLLFTALDTSFSAIDVGLRRMFHGLESGSLRTIGKGVRDIAEGATPLWSPIHTILDGDKMMKEIFNAGSQGPEIKAFVSALVAAGGRAKQDNFYRTGAVNRLFQTFKDPGIMNKIPLAWRWFPALFEATSYPLMEYLVPRMKLGTFMKMAQLEIDKLPPGFSVIDAKKVLARSWDSVDNRLGQLVYDNLFWNRTFKDLGLLGVRSLGWNVGTVREVGGALLSDWPKTLIALLRGKRPEFTPKMGYVAGMLTWGSLAGGMLNYAMTGEAPKSYVDYIAPRTGYTRPDGTEDRIMLPTYMRDMIAIGTEGPYKLAKNKLNPGLTTAYALLENRDFMDSLIRDPEDEYTKQASDMLKWMADLYFPIGIKASTQLAETYGESNPMRFLPVLGITPAPGYIDPEKREISTFLEEKQPRRRKIRREFKNPYMLDRMFGTE